MPSLYLAGPDVFRAAAAALAAAKKTLCARYGFDGLDPLDLDPPQQSTPPATATAIFRANVALMRRADGIVADLSPFRGPSADPGTVFELGFMLGQNKPAFGYSTAMAPFHDRTTAVCGVRAPGGHWTDTGGLAIEDFGLHDNLMIDRALAEAGHPLVMPDRGQDALWCLERCLQAARTHFSAH